ncbi:AAA family ATPase [Pendulispora rubella]|uniref:AAA family ATPase n=1 Tax=Pendulispora rubella TaxID=2741070 RepID=A0ABZ2LHE0_9BACT
MQAVIFVGIQASGKSTFFRERFADSHVRINMDMLRTRHREELLLRACIEGQQRFVADNTNPTIEERSRYIVPAKRAGFRITGYYFTAPIDEALRRNATRDAPQRIPEIAIRGTRNRLVLPSLAEGFDELFHVRPDATGGFFLENWVDEVR